MAGVCDTTSSAIWGNEPDTIDVSMYLELAFSSLVELLLHTPSLKKAFLVLECLENRYNHDCLDTRMQYVVDCGKALQDLWDLHVDAIGRDSLGEDEQGAAEAQSDRARWRNTVKVVVEEDLATEMGALENTDFQMRFKSGKC
ncbi:hypothetical protein LZ554_007779 [Drepanopeziza brunnea f. sp. 'monogermtubi']|nr:hypothetical protein LZ554_007779 [Drepanopeziza brunnea f. sp. 'monogermtubi']